jgi:ParB-like chromosome segregation protein Spo0J
LKLNSKNPRYAKDAAFRSLIKSIKDFPEMLSVRPIIVDEKNVILGGNMRYLAAIEAGLKEVPTIQIKLSEKQKKEFIIKDNVQSGQWDIDTLANEWDQDLLAH